MIVRLFILVVIFRAKTPCGTSSHSTFTFPATGGLSRILIVILFSLRLHLSRAMSEMIPSTIFSMFPCISGIHRKFRSMFYISFQELWLVINAGYRACKDVVLRLLDKDEMKRLGSKSGASEVKQHKWFSKINWGLLRNTQPPVSFSSLSGDSLQILLDVNHAATFAGDFVVNNHMCALVHSGLSPFAGLVSTAVSCHTTLVGPDSGTVASSFTMMILIAILCFGGMIELVNAQAHSIYRAIILYDLPPLLSSKVRHFLLGLAYDSAMAGSPTPFPVFYNTFC